MSAARAAAAAVLAAGVVAGAAPGAAADPSVVSGVEIPFPIVDTAGGCASTGRLRLYPDITPGLVAHEEIRAVVDSPACPGITWEVRVRIADNAPGYPTETASGMGTGTATAAQDVRYAVAGPVTPGVFRGPARVSLQTRWLGSNGVSGCVVNDWVMASYAEAYEAGPVVPCDDAIRILD